MKKNRSDDEVKTLYKNKNIAGLEKFALNNPKFRSKAIAYSKRLKRKQVEQTSNQTGE